MINHTAFDCYKEIYIRMVNGDSLDKAKMNTIYLEDINDQERYRIDTTISSMKKQFNINDFEAYQLIFNGYVNGLEG